MSGKDPVPPGLMGRMWGVVEFVAEKDLKSAKTGHRTIERRGWIHVKGQGWYKLRLHGATACIWGFCNAPDTTGREVANAELLQAPDRDWFSALIPLTVNIEPVPGSPMTKSEILKEHATRLVECAGDVTVRTREHILRGQEVLIDYPYEKFDDDVQLASDLDTGQISDVIAAHSDLRIDPRLAQECNSPTAYHEMSGSDAVLTPGGSGDSTE